MIRLLYESPHSVFGKRPKQHNFILEASPRYQEFVFTDKSSDSVQAHQQLQLTLALPWTYYAGWNWRGDGVTSNVSKVAITSFGCRRNEINSDSMLEKIFALPLPHYDGGFTRPLHGCFGIIYVPADIDMTGFYPYIVDGFYTSRWNYFMSLDPAFHPYLIDPPSHFGNRDPWFSGWKSKLCTAMDAIDKYQNWSDNYDLDNICDAPFVGIGKGSTLAELVYQSGKVKKSHKTFPDYISTPPLGNEKKLKVKLFH